MSSNKDDKILEMMRASVQRDTGFKMLMEEYQNRLYWQIKQLVRNHEDTNDILQDVFIKVYNAIPNFRGDSKLYSWLFRIARNESLTFINKKSKVRIVDIDNHKLINEKKADTSIDAEDIIHKLNNAIGTLPEKQKEVFNMRYFSEMKYKEMSKLLNTSEGALKASYHHAVKKIEKYLTNEG